MSYPTSHQNPPQVLVLPFHALTISISLLFLPLLIFLLKNKNKVGDSKKPLPPRPPGLPIIGNLHQLGRLPHRSLRDLAARHGPVMMLKLGQVPVLVVSSPEAAREVLKTQDLAFCSRPSFTTWRKLGYGGLDLGFAPYSPYWLQIRKITTMELLGAQRVRTSRSVRVEEVGTLVSTIARSSTNGTAVNLSDMFVCLTSNLICRVVFGQRFSKEGECNRSDFHELINESLDLMNGLWPGDFFPSIKWLVNEVTGLRSRLDRSFKTMDVFLEREIEAALQRDESCDDFARFLVGLLGDPTLEIPMTRNHVKALLMVIFVAASDTTAEVLVWAMTQLIRNPKILAKATNEVRTVGAGKDLFEEADIHRLDYLKLVVKEALRLHLPGPLLIPRETREECMIDGYVIPAKTWVYINAWAIGRDPRYWDEPETFRPERFEGSSVDYKGQHPEFIPFGGGRRVCPGMPLATVTLELTLASLLHCFDWSVPEGRGEVIDMEERFGIVVHKNEPLVLMATPANRK